MKAIIKIEKDNLSSIQFKQGNKVLDWSAMTRAEQVKLLNAIAQHHGLFSRFVKEA